jgi:hypothetical protein
MAASVDGHNDDHGKVGNPTLNRPSPERAPIGRDGGASRPLPRVAATVCFLSQSRRSALATGTTLRAPKRPLQMRKAPFVQRRIVIEQLRFSVLPSKLHTWVPCNVAALPAIVPL